MRLALPLWYCLDYDTQAKLAPMLTDPFIIPRCEWTQWPSGLKLDGTEVLKAIPDDIDYDKFMRQKPHHPVRVK